MSRTPSTTVRPGLALGSSQYETEATTYLQQRLIIYYKVTFAIAVGLYVAASMLLSMYPETWNGNIWLSADRITHFGAMVVGAAILIQLRRRRYGQRMLLVFDNVGFYLGVGTTLVIYHAAYDRGPVLMPGVLVLFMMLRAVVVPSSARCTAYMCIPVLLFTFLIQWSHGTIYVGPGEPVMSGFYPVLVAWTQVLLAATVAIAAVASHVNFGLRRQVLEAKRLGQYKLEEKIGEGGMGEVYRATHSMLRRPTAIKLLRPDITGIQTIERFEREVRETSRLTHPNTVSIYDYGRTPDGIFYYAMEFLEGLDLRTIVDKTGPMAPARVIHVLRQVCGALAEAHAKRLVHRDIKPGNVVLCAYGGGQDVAKLLDFGLVKDVSGTDSRLTQMGEICGTPETLAPEVLAGEPATGLSDMYSLAVVGCYLLTGKQIFDAKTPTEYVGHHLHSPPIPPSARNPAVPKDLESVLLRCLAKDPGSRPADILAMAAELEVCEHAGKWTQDLATAWWSAYDLREVAAQ